MLRIGNSERHPLFDNYNNIATYLNNLAEGRSQHSVGALPIEEALKAFGYFYVGSDKKAVIVEYFKDTAVEYDMAYTSWSAARLRDRKPPDETSKMLYHKAAVYYYLGAAVHIALGNFSGAESFLGEMKRCLDQIGEKHSDQLKVIETALRRLEGVSHETPRNGSGNGSNNGISGVSQHGSRSGDISALGSQIFMVQSGDQDALLVINPALEEPLYFFFDLMPHASFDPAMAMP